MPRPQNTSQDDARPAKRMKSTHDGEWQQLISFEIQSEVVVKTETDAVPDHLEQFVLPKALLQFDGLKFAGTISRAAPNNKIVLEHITAEQFTTLLEAMASGEFSLVAINCGILFAESIVDVPLANKFLQKLHEFSVNSKFQPPLLTPLTDELITCLDMAYSKQPVAIQRHLLVALIIQSISYKPSKHVGGTVNRSLDMNDFSIIMNSAVPKPWFPDFAKEFTKLSVMHKGKVRPTWTFPPLTSFNITSFAQAT